MERTEIIAMLEPFAEEAGEWSDIWGDSDPITIEGETTGLSVGDFRAIARLRETLIAEELASIETQTEALRKSTDTEKGVIDTAVHAHRQGWITHEARDLAINKARNVVVARNNKGLCDE